MTKKGQGKGEVLKLRFHKLVARSEYPTDDKPQPHPGNVAEQAARVNQQRDEASTQKASMCHAIRHVKHFEYHWHTIANFIKSHRVDSPQ